MYLVQEKLQHINTIAHEGKVIVVATDAEGNIWYTVKQDGFEDSYLNTPADSRTGFETWKELALPDEETDKSVVDKETAELTYKDNPSQFIIQSRYKTKNESAIAPVQLVSVTGHIYVFRQSKYNTLLVDRFVLDGMTNELTRKLEVRFKRSRQKYKASEKMKMGTGGLQNVDSLDYRDISNNFFYEPTTELCLINNLINGWFSVVQVPTNEHEKYRWHIFAYNSDSNNVEITTILASEEGLFNVKDYTVLEPKSEEDNTLVPRSIKGVIKRTLALSQATTNTRLTITNSLSATKYDLQQEQETSTKDSQGNPIKQLLRTSTRVMLAIPTDKGTAALTFAIASDGTLSQIDETPETTIIRSYERDVLLPLNTLEAIKAIADTTPPAVGTVKGFALGTAEDDAEDLVVVTSQEAGSLQDGELVKIQNTASINALYSATTVDEDSFTLNITPTNSLGNWEKIEAEEGGLVFDGEIVSYQTTADGKLLVSAINHGLQSGDQVQIVGTQDYNNTFPVKKLDNTHFAIERRWMPGEAVNVKLESMKRRGIVLDGVDDYIEIPSESFPVGNEITVSFWAKGGNTLPKETAVIEALDKDNQRLFVVHLPWSDGSIYFACGNANDRISKVAADTKEYKGEWTHWAFTKNATTGEMKIYRNGALWHSGTGLKKSLLKAAKVKIGVLAAENRGYYHGNLADFCIWKRALTDQEIKAGMYLQFTGKEVDLVGYWRLGGVSEGTERTVFDFSVNANDGIVFGGAYAGGRQLNRTLRDNKTPAVKYINTELFAVSQRSTYIEEFEFKTLFSDRVPVVDGLQVYLSGESLTGNRWEDLSGKNNHATQAANCTLASSYNVSNYKGKNFAVARCNTTCGMILPDSLILNQPFTVIIIDRYYGNIKGRTLQSRDRNWLVGKWSGNNSCYMEGWISQSSATVNEFSLSTATLTGTTPQYYLDGNFKNNTGGSAAPGRLGFGRVGPYSADVSEADIACVLIYNRVLSDAERQKVEKWLGDRYGISIPNPAVNPSAVTAPVSDINQLFKFAYWGKTSRSAEAEIAISAVPDDFKDLGNGWYRASCSFTVPDGVAMVRSFGISDVKGNWDTLEIRKHRIRLVSNAITEAKYTDVISLKSLDDKYIDLQKDLNNLTQKEQQEFSLLETKNDLEDKLERFANQAQTRLEFNRLSALVTQLQTQQTELQTAYNNKKSNPLNYWCYIDNVWTAFRWEIKATNVSGYSVGLGNMTENKPSLQKFKFSESSPGSGKYYIISNNFYLRNVGEDLRLDGKDGSGLWKFTKQGTANQGWPPVSYDAYYIEKDGDSTAKCTCASRSGNNSVLAFCSSSASGRSGDDGKSQKWTLSFDEKDKVDNTIELAKTELDNKTTELTINRTERDRLDKILKEAGTGADQWRTDLIAVNRQLDQIQQAIAVLNTNLIAAAKAKDLIAQEMGKVGEDRKGLISQGALLGFVRPTSRLNAIETCEGNVQLSYFDEKGQMRQTNYDATSDSLNTAFEQWIPDGMLTGINLNNSRGGIKLTQTLENSEQKWVNWTFETWFAYPFSDRLVWRILTTSDDDNQQIVVYNNKQLGIRTNGYFHDCDYNLDRLSRGWHHLAICTKDRSTYFYIDGKQVGETLAKSTLDFDGEKDYISLPTMKIDFSQGFTVEAWVLYHDFSTWSRIIDLSTGSDLNNIYLDNVENTKKLRLTVKDGNTVKQIESGEVLEIGKWTHLAAVIDAQANVSLYKNGNLIASSKGVLPKNTTPDWTKNFIGKSKWVQDSIYNGQIGEVRLWNSPRTQTQIQANFGKTLKGTEFALVGYWQFTDGKAQDSSLLKYHGTIQGTPNPIKLAAALPGNIRAIGNYYQQPLVENQSQTTALLSAIALNGSTDYISIPDSQSLRISSYTAEIWIKPNGVPTEGFIGILGKPGRNFNIWLTNTGFIHHRFHTQSSTNVGAPDTPNGSIKWDEWNHIAITNDGTTAKTYINGQLMATGATGGVLIVDKTPLYIGRSPEGNNSNYFKGEIAEARVWNKVCTQAEIQANMGKTLSSSETGLVGYWQFAGGTAQDSGVNKNNGTVTGSPQVTTFPVQVSRVSVPLQPNGALNFDGVDDYIKIPLNEPETNVTHELWFKTDAPNCGIFSVTAGNVVGGGTHDRHLYLSGGNIKARIWSTSDNEIITSTSLNLADNNWHHLAHVFGSSINGQQLYIDGQLVASGTKGTSGSSTQDAIVIGYSYDAQAAFFKGQIAEVRVWNKARTQAEIQPNMTQLLTGSETNLIGYWRLNDGTAKDYLASNGKNGTIFGGAQTTTPFDKIQTQSVEISTVKPKLISNQFGKLAEIRIWNLDLSDEEIAVNSKTLLTGNEPGLAAYYTMKPLAAGTWTDNDICDRSGNNNHAVMDGASLWACAAPIGNLGHNVMQFDGKNDYVELDYQAKFNSNIFTVSCWAKVSGGQGTWRSVITSRDLNTLAGYTLYAGDNNKWQFALGNGVSWITATGSDIVINSWTHLAANIDGINIRLYINGELAGTQALVGITAVNRSRPLRIGAGTTETTPQLFFNGQIAEVSIWSQNKAKEQIQAFAGKSLTGQELGLVSYLPLNSITSNKTPDLANNLDATVTEAAIATDNTLPIGGDAVVSCEYSSIVVHPTTQRKTAIMRRFFAIPGLNGVEVLPEKRIETLILQWISNAQFAPTLLGYIEGAPPIPTENLTVQPDYNGGTSVELAVSEDMEFSWNRSQDTGLGASIDLFVGADTESYAGIGVATKAANVRAGVKGNFNTSYQFTNETNITASSSLNMTDKLELRGTPERSPKFQNLGTRYIPKNVGYALVISGLADVFITKLARSGRMVGYQVRPVEGIPPDVNTITFLINPAYTMNGSLDGMTGSSATSDRFFRHVPEMRSQYGSLYPASYYRLREAYDLKQAIEQEDKRRESYFAQFNVASVDESAFNQAVDSGAAPSDISVQRQEDKSTTASMTDKEKQAAAEANLEKQQQEIEASSDKQSAATKQKQAEIKSKIADRQKQAHATDSFAGWQKKMEDIQVRAGKRNIVNTYVWDADGGLRTEVQSFASTAQHTIGGSFSFDAGLGGEGGFGVFGAKVELTALATVNMTQTMSKTESRSKGIQLNVDLSGVESVGITDYNDYPIMPGEKVDRYRFMSFYLEGSTNNFSDFFNYVVDPEWLRSNDEEARALRQAQGKANKTWRVLHRVTYVERPALMGFGRDLRQVADRDRATQEILDYFTQLEARHQELKAKMDELLNIMRNK